MFFLIFIANLVIIIPRYLKYHIIYYNKTSFGGIRKLGEKIKQLRKSKGISQEELASTLKINRNFLSRIETGKSEPTASMLKNIAKIFNVDLNSLLDVKSLPSDNSNKLKYITDNCKYLDEKDIDFIIRIISIMKEEYVKVNTNLE